MLPDSPELPVEDDVPLPEYGTVLFQEPEELELFEELQDEPKLLDDDELLYEEELRELDAFEDDLYFWPPPALE